MRGCFFGGYFSSVFLIFFVVEKIGNLILCLNFIVYEIIYDDFIKKVIGVKVKDIEFGEDMVFNVKVIFLCVFVIVIVSILF